MSFKKEFFKKSPVRHNMPEYGFKGSNSRISLLAGSKHDDPTLTIPVDEKGNGIPANSKIAREHYKELMNKLYGNSFVSSSGGKPSDRELLINRGDNSAEIVLPVARPSKPETEEEKKLRRSRELLIDRGDSKAEVVFPVAKPSQQTEREKELEVLKSSL